LTQIADGISISTNADLLPPMASPWGQNQRCEMEMW